MPEGLTYRAMYREFYPAILAFAKNDWKKLAEQLPRIQEAKTWVRNLQEDSRRIKDGVSLVQWPEQQLLRMVQEYTKHICKILIDRGRKLSRGEIAQFEAMGIDWKSILSTTPEERLASANDWKRPFDTINLQLDGSMFSMLEELLDEMRSWVMRGHGWFGVGKWNMANRCYLNALTWALAFNDLPGVEIIVRFLTDAYTANGDWQSASQLADEFYHSPFAPNARITFFATQENIYCSVIMANALNGHWQGVRSWLDRIPAEFDRRPNHNVSGWRIVELLSDVYTYQHDTDALDRLQEAISKTMVLIDSPQQQFSDIMLTTTARANEESTLDSSASGKDNSQTIEALKHAFAEYRDALDMQGQVRDFWMGLNYLQEQKRDQVG